MYETHTWLDRRGPSGLFGPAVTSICCPKGRQLRRIEPHFVQTTQMHTARARLAVGRQQTNGVKTSMRLSAMADTRDALAAADSRKRWQS